MSITTVGGWLKAYRVYDFEGKYTFKYKDTIDFTVEVSADETFLCVSAARSNIFTKIMSPPPMAWSDGSGLPSGEIPTSFAYSASSSLVPAGECAMLGRSCWKATRIVIFSDKFASDSDLTPQRLRTNTRKTGWNTFCFAQRRCATGRVRRSFGGA